MNEQISCANRINAEYEHEVELLLIGTRKQEPTDEQIESYEIPAGWSGHFREQWWKELLLWVDVGLPVDVELEDFNTHGCPPPDSYDKVTHYQRSTGGPGDGWIIYQDDDGHIRAAFYYFQDWFDGAVKKVVDQDVLEALGYMLEDI